MQQQQQPPKYARYKGARQPAANNAADRTNSTHVPSRYHRPQSASSSGSGASPALQPASFASPNPPRQSPPTATTPKLHHAGDQNNSYPHTSSSSFSNQRLSPHDVTLQPAQLWPPIEYSLDMPARDEQQKPQHAPYAPQYDVDEWEALGRNDSPIQHDKDTSNHVSSHSQSSSQRHRRRSLIENEDEDRHFGCFRFRRKKTPGRNLEKAPLAVDTPNPDAFIGQGGGGIVPGTDAPRSAANAGERPVQVFYDNMAMQFPVDLETTPADLLSSAANCFMRPIEPKTVALVEHFAKIGIQRPLRRYEHVRNVVNSWDAENNNRLVIKSAKETGADPSLLHASTVTRERPPECSFDLQYSQRPAKWAQRYITVRSDGQIMCAKKAADKNSTNVCHLSDFDVYIPTPEALKQKLRPPKEHCIAIKSQQPANLFESKENFVHFFSTADKTVAVRFYVAVQAWRSWYLVNQLGEGKKSATHQPLNTSPQRKPSTRRSVDKPSTTGESPYKLGSMKPLMDMSQFDAAAQPVNASPARQRSVRRNPSVKDKQRSAQPQLSENEPLANIFTANNPPTDAAIPRTQSVRQPGRRVVSPSTARPGTPDGSDKDQYPQPRGTEDKRRSTDLTRSKSKREPPKPLIDLTPAYRPPPQHTRKGRGIKNENGGLLVDAATTPADPINAPPAVDWRGLNGPAAARQLANDISGQAKVPSTNTTGRRPSENDGRAMSMKAGQPDRDAFVRGGLVDSVPTTSGGQPVGRGVMQGSHAAGPMVDLSEPSEYVPGSLLARQETNS